MAARVEVLGCPIDALDMGQTVEAVLGSIRAGRPLRHVVVNAAKLVNMRRDPALRASVLGCDLINADGQSVVWAAKLLGRPLPERVAGIDLMGRLVEAAAREGLRVFLLGARREVVEKVAQHYERTYGPGLVAGFRDGYFTEAQEPEVARQIGQSGAHILLVAISSPKKEIFMDKYQDLLRVPFTMGVGGSFDVVSGLTRRAPLWMQRVGLEWLFRLAQEPGRMWKRYLVTNSWFIYLVFRERLTGKS